MGDRNDLQEIPKQVRDDAGLGGGKHVGLPVQAAGPVDIAKSVGFWVKVMVELTGVLKDAWKYLTLIFAGIIAGLVYAMKSSKPVQNISTDQFINDQSRDLKVNKIKQKGENLSLDITSEMRPKDLRKERRAERRAERKRVKEKKGDNGDDGDKTAAPEGDEIGKLVVVVGLIMSFRGWY